MKLAHFELEQPIEFEQEKIISWVIEDSQTFWKFSKELINQINGISGKFVLSNDLKTLKLESDAQIITSLFDVDFSSKKITNLISKRLLRTVAEDEYLIKFNEIAKDIKFFLEEVVSDADLPVEIGDFEQDDLIKLANIKASESNLFFENLVNYLELVLNLLCPKLLVLVNIKQYLNVKQLEDFKKFLMYQDVSVLFLDYMFSNNIKCDSKTYFLDKDLCEFEYAGGNKIESNII